jgi:hypothetical protein
MVKRWELYFTRRLAFSLLFLILLIAGFQFNSVAGQTVVYDSVASAKLQFLKKSLQQDHRHTQTWWYSWLSIYSAATIGQGVVYFTSNDLNTKQDMALGAATTLLGAAGQFISPFYPSNEFDHFMFLPENNNEDRFQKLAAAEKLLNQWSERERKALTWDNHILPTTVNLGAGLITWLVFGRFEDGLISFALNTVVTETQIWTQPLLAKRQYKKYIQMYLNGNEAYSYVPEVNWYLETIPGGIGIKITF